MIEGSLLIDEDFQWNWDGSDKDIFAIKPISPEKGMLLANEVESFMNEYGIRGATNSSTSPQYHQNIVGIDGWIVDLKKQTYTRVDGLELRLAATHVPILSFNQIKSFFIKQPGTIIGKIYGV